jgi:integrase
MLSTSTAVYRAREITGLEWSRVDLPRKTAWLDQAKNGTPRGVPLNRDAVAVLEEQVEKQRSIASPTTASRSAGS